MYKIVRRVQAYDDVYDTKSPIPHNLQYCYNLHVDKFMQNLIIPEGLENWILHNTS